MARKRHRAGESLPAPGVVTGTLRILGGQLRGRPIRYLGDPRTRPMKQRVREAVFNLIGGDVAGAHVVDLFAGTGALAWEAISRGARSAVLLERHYPTAKVIRENAVSLGLTDRVEVVTGDTFAWARRLLPTTHGAGTPHWLIFCSPPYELYVTRGPDLVELLERILAVAPPSSTTVVESDERFDTDRLSTLGRWDVRQYPPAVVAVGRR